VNPWRWWVERCYRPVDARPLALVRVLVPLTVFLDLLRVAQIGMIPHYFRPYEAGGINKGQDDFYILGDLFGDMWAGPIAWAVSAVSMLLISLGIAVRPAIVVAVFFYSQLGHCYPAGDRGIDRFVRTILLILLFSGVHQRVVPWAKDRVKTVSAWAPDLIRFAMVMMYMAAGVSKLMQQPRWLATGGMPVVYRIMTDPMAAHMDPVTMESFYWPLRIMGWATIALELTPWLIFTRFAPYWAVGALGMHIGIAATMELGMFSFSMMSLYPLLFAPWIIAGLDRWERRRAG
jgi:hypothetical protein